MTPFSFWSQLLFLQKEKKMGGGVGGGGGGNVRSLRLGGGGGNVRSLRLKNWLPLESIIIYKVVRS